MKKYILLIMLFLVCGCDKIIEEKPDEVILFIKENVTVYSDVTLKDIVEKSNVSITNLDLKINSDKLGKVNVDIYYDYNNKKYVYKTSTNIVDDVKPKIIGGTVKTILKDQEYDMCKLITYGDNYDKKVSCKTEGRFTSKEYGTYRGNIILTDSSNNEIKQSVTLYVTERIINSETPKDVYFSDVYRIHKNNNTLVGIDVSRWQGDVDYKKVKDSGADFVIIRMGIQSNYDKEISMDSYFEKNYENAKANGLMVGVYTYSSANTVELAKKHATWTVNELKGKKLDLPIVFDWENWSKWNDYNMSFHDINEIYNEFSKIVKENNYDSMLYSSKYYLENIWTNDLNDKVWLAHYTDKTNYKGDYYIWQMTNQGKIDGINGAVDINILYK